MANESAFERVRTGIDMCVQKRVDVINLSLGPPNTKFDPNDLLQMATKAAYDNNIPVVVAAGNFGPGKLQALAQAPWVISVGAVDINARLLPDSGTGAVNGKGPTLVSYGLPAEIANPDPKWDKFGPGTSFAAPRVTGVAAYIRACLRLIITDLSAQQSKQWSFMSEPIKVPVVGIVDTGIDPARMPPLQPLVEWDVQHGHTQFQFTRTGAEEQWYARVVEELTNAGASCTLRDGPEPVKRVLQLMAQRLDDYADHEVGAGLVSIEEAQMFLSSLTPDRWFGIFCPEAAQKLGADRLEELNATLGPLWDTTKVVYAMQPHLYDGIRLLSFKVY
jgi:hypothetical protein